jgi:hypothetical protein
MPKTVERHIRKTCTLEDVLEGTCGNVLRVNRRTLDGGEHKPALLPFLTSPKLYLYLPLPWLLRASTAVLGKCTVRLLAFFG